MRTYFIMKILSSPLQLVMCRVASDLGIFEALMVSKDGIPTDDLAAKTKADKILIVRILRYLASYGLIQSPSPHVWASSALTPFLANPAFAAGLRFGTTCILPSAMAIPTLLERNSFQGMSSSDRTAFQIGHSTQDSMFQWLANHPQDQRDFQKWMGEAQRHQEPIFNVFPLDKFIPEANDGSTPLFVDVGGANGHVCQQIRAKYPDWNGRVINQDLQAIRVGLDSPSHAIEHQDYDFFTEQPIKGARIYYLRNILQNWSDAECAQILARVCEAMSHRSVLIIDSAAMADYGTNWHDCYVDIVMGMFFGARVRTIEEYKAMAETAGLVWDDAIKYGEGSNQQIFVLFKRHS
ncbi:S-adenosyl-L-methionine-dependent methyltransferase [Xylariaceae sp. FL0255]|nr:S-adenosyl-L-methionine-dependent methyltransferase [Xylariaceae sp. FL0255]